MSEFRLVEVSPIESPFPEGVLPTEHQQQIQAIRTCLRTWLEARQDCNKAISGARERMAAAMNGLVEFRVEPPYAYTPSPPYAFRSILLSFTKCYWMALIASFTPEEREEMAHRLECVPSFPRRVPTFEGKHCVERPEELEPRVYEGLMRTMHVVALGMTSQEITRIWREIGEVGVQTWEEQD